MEELMKNNEAFLKLEEFMYLSLIGKFDYIHTCDNKTYVCFTTTDENINKDAKLKPVYITSLDVVSDRVAKARITAFEKKIFSETFAEFLDRSEADEKTLFCYSRRIKDYINNFYSNAKPTVQKTIVNSYKNNLINLKNKEIMDNAQFEGALEFITRQLIKDNEKTN